VATNTGIKIVLKDLSKDLVKGVMLRVAVKASEKAKEKAPKDMGGLQNSIVYTATDTEATIYTDMEYAHYQEYGTGIYAEDGQGRSTPWTYFDIKRQKFVTTSGNKPQPYMRPAAYFAGSQAEIDKSVAAEMRRLTQ